LIVGLLSYPQLFEKRRAKMKKLAISLAIIFLSTILSTLTLASTAAKTDHDPTYSFDLTGPQATEDGSGNTILITGAGSFDTGAATVIGSGAFTILNGSGAVVSRGSWKATGFVSFCSRGGPNPGSQGGVLVITVSLNGGAPVNMTVNCHIFAPPNNANTCSPGPEGVTVGSFTNIIRGRTLFNLN